MQYACLAGYARCLPATWDQEFALDAQAVPEKALERESKKNPRVHDLQSAYQRNCIAANGTGNQLSVTVKPHTQHHNRLHKKKGEAQPLLFLLAEVVLAVGPVIAARAETTVPERNGRSRRDRGRYGPVFRISTLSPWTTR